MIRLALWFINRLIPARAEERRLYFFLGRECWLVREPGEGWFVKVQRCNFCGKCCEVEEGWPLGTEKIEGRLYCACLNKTGNEWFCEAGFIAPFNCCKDKPLRLAHEECVIRYEKVTD